MSDHDDWTVIENKKKKKKTNQKPKISEIRNVGKNSNIGNKPQSDGRSFEKNRPNEATTVFKKGELSDEEEQHEENIILETPLVWHKFALIGDVKSSIDMALEKYKIHPWSETAKLKDLGSRIVRDNWNWSNDYDLENDLDRYSRRCGKQFIFISIIPQFTPREYGSGSKLYFVHVRFNYYFLAEAKPIQTYIINIPNYYGFLGDKPTHDPVSVDSSDVEDNRTNFMRIMKLVEGRMAHDKFQEKTEKPPIIPFKKKPYYSALSNEDFEKYKNAIYRCKLYLEDSYSGYGEILDEKHLGRKIYLHNRHNCFQAFNQDTVNIMVFQQSYGSVNQSKDNRTKDRKATEPPVWSGRVVSVEHSDVKPVNKIFLCKLTFGHANMMIPICNTIPVIAVDNDYAKERVRMACDDLVTGLRDVVGINNLIQRQVEPDRCKSFADKSFITLKTLNIKLETVVSRLQYVDCYRCDFIFLVLYRQWSNDSNFPIGDVVGLYTPDSSFWKTLPLIAVSCDLSVVSIEEEGELKNEIKKIKVETLKNKNAMRENEKEVGRTVFCFRYKNQPYNELAYSYEDLTTETFKLGIHVVNVEKYVQQNDFLDKYAMKQFFTFLTPIIENDDDDSKPLYLFSETLTNGILSLNKEHSIDVISFYFVVERATFTFSSFSNLVLEQIMLNHEFDANIVDEMILGESTQYLYLTHVYRACARYRLNRTNSHNVPPSWFYPDHKLKMNFSTFIISNELEILANEFVAKLLTVNNVDNFPVNVKEWIHHQNKLDSWIHEVRRKCCVKFFPTLKTVFGTNRIENASKTFRLSGQHLDEVMRNEEINLFKCDMLFPDVSYYFYKLGNIVSWNHIMAHIDCGDSPFTVSMTRPLSCFNDMLLERLLLSLNGSTPWNYRDEDIDNICSSYRDNRIILEKYQKICRGYEIKDRFEKASFILDCVFETGTEDSIVFNHPLLRDVHHENFIFFDCLGLSKVKQVLEEEDDETELVWEARIFVFDAVEKERIDRDMVLDDIYLYETVIWRPNLNKQEITPADRNRINILKSENKYPINLTSESSRNMDTKISLSMKLKKRQILRIQFNYNYSFGIMKITPELLIVNPHHRVCLGHRHDPFKYFVHPDSLSKINYLRFVYIDAYKEQFKILNRIEGIHQTITDGASYFIHNVTITWIGAKPDLIYGLVIVDHSWCKERFIKIGHELMRIEDPVNAFKKAVKWSSMDFLVCIQTFLEDRNVHWLGHAHVASEAFISDSNVKKVLLTLKLIHSSFPMKPKVGQIYSMEIMETPITARVLDRNLKKLEEDSIIGRIVMKKIPNVPFQAHIFIDYEMDIQSSMVVNYDLNKVQFQALNIAINQEFSLIWGPPGTGKTMVGCIIAFAFDMLNKRLDSNTKSTVLYCGPSNQSVDVVAEKLMKMFGDKCPKLLRIYSNDVMNNDFPHPGSNVNNENCKTPESLKPIALHHIIRQFGKPFAEIIQQFQTFFEENHFRDRITRAEYAKKLFQYNNKIKSAFKNEVENGNYKILLCTTVGSCKKLLDSLTISQVIIDESGMCCEPEALGPMIRKEQLKNVVFIGDHKQLRPIITSAAAKGKQLSLSLFERIYNPRKTFCTMLNTQYRMHPSICEFPSRHFYSGELVTALSESWTGVPSSFITDASKYNGLQYVGLRQGFEAQKVKNNVTIADGIWKGVRKTNYQSYQYHIDFNSNPVKEKILFIKVEGNEVNQAVSGAAGHAKSKGNPLEVAAVEILYEALIKKIKNKKIASESILVITQYRLQEHLIKNALATVLDRLKVPGPPQISTVIRSQGSECDYVIFSTVRSLPHPKDIDTNPSSGWISKYLGFITDPNQLNVAITRAKKGLFIVGNSNLLSVNQDWKSLITNLVQRDCVAENIFDINLA